jgi:hypothetical protein
MGNRSLCLKSLSLRPGKNNLRAKIPVLSEQRKKLRRQSKRPMGYWGLGLDRDQGPPGTEERKEVSSTHKQVLRTGSHASGAF